MLYPILIVFSTLDASGSSSPLLVVMKIPVSG